MMTIFDFTKKKLSHEKISMITCYDAWTAKIISETNIDCILVGDSLAMVMHGYDSTLFADSDLMSLHVSAVARSVKNKFIIGDMPFLSYRKDLNSNMSSVEKIMKSGAQAIKLEGCKGNLELIRHIVDSGVPVMGHLGLTPQSIHQIGGYKVQRDEGIIREAQQLEEAGCFSLVLECIPNQLAETITSKIKIPTIGIGAGVNCDGQVLVLQDMLGMNAQFQPKFLKKYLNGHELIKSALNTFHAEVTSGAFPSLKESY
jgi:3-methyl-2-oxobutanoate hydroxymethyltransferase